MTDLRKAAKRLLEALDDGWIQRDDLVAITLRQALAQPEQVSIEPPDYVEPITFDYHEGWEEGFKAGVESVKNKKESTPSNVDPLLHGGDGNYIKQAQPEQEPVAWNGWVLREVFFDNGDPCGHREPPSKEWVSLTDEQIENFDLPNKPTVKQFVRFVEAALRSKNT